MTAETTSPSSSSSSPTSSASPSVFLQTTDSSDMFRYVSGQAWTGCAVGTGVAGTAQLLAYRYLPAYQRYTNVSARAFLLFAGAGVGFTLASEWAMMHYFRYMDRPELTGFQRLSDLEQSQVMAKARRTQVEFWKDFAWENRFRLIAGAWAGTLGSVMYRDFRNPLLSSVHKFGHARMWAQGVTIVAIMFAFYFNDETGPNAAKYTDPKSRDRDL